MGYLDIIETLIGNVMCELLYKMLKNGTKEEVPPVGTVGASSNRTNCDIIL